MDRMDDLVLPARGLNIYSSEIRNVIFSHPVVLESSIDKPGTQELKNHTGTHVA